MDKKINVSVLGFYGMDNFGDDLFVEVFRRALQKAYFTPKFFGAKPLNGAQERFCGLRARRLYGLSKYLDKLLRVINNTLSVVDSSVVLFGGGSVFGKYSSFHQRKITVFLANLLSRRVAAIGVSFGPFSNLEQRRRFADLLANFEPLVFRDIKSVQLYSSCFESGNAVVQEDVVFSAPSLLSEWTKNLEKRKSLVLAVHLSEYKEALIDAFDRCHENYDLVEVLSLESSANELCRDIYDVISSRQPNVALSLMEYNSSDDCRNAMLTIAGAGFVITSKLHGAVVSAAFCVPFYLYEYQEKCSDFIEFLGYRNFNKISRDPSFLTRSARHLRDFSGRIEGVDDVIHKVKPF